MALQELDGSAAKKELDSTGSLKLSLASGEVELAPEELLIDTAQKEGYTSVSDRGLTVVLDTALNDRLIEEGFVREIVSKLQSMRKDAGFNVTDHIEVYCQGNEKVAPGACRQPGFHPPRCPGQRLPHGFPGRLHRLLGRQWPAGHLGVKRV